ncbi:helix-turn-helix domain-containing protein [Actinopolyspora mortivallis]|uniref:Helix-turn-helix domain-containing protein n=1 Tax=Actinopolyspora mortivallis TaxID=33906 RepID=A0A2T0GYK8_ACTMO|nr:helix-turn-helix domain-containing protein [Actinopolyspora mortivallis]PRW64202.1 hypothetical protein CEP50_06075 [Actinopolyspora mortivallis]
MPFNTTAFELRSDISDILCSWASLIVDTRRVSRPERTVPSVSGFLLTHLDWLAEHEVGAELSAETAGLVERARRILSSEKVHAFAVGSCPERACTGTLRASVHPDTPGRLSEVRCTVERTHRWAESEWLRLGERVSGESGRTRRPMWLGVAEITRMWNVSRGSVYRLASERSWRRCSRGRKTYYHSDDVAETMRDRVSRS